MFLRRNLLMRILLPTLVAGGGVTELNYSLAAYGLYCYLGTFKANTRAECYFKYA